MENLHPILLALIGTMISFSGTAIGAAFVFLTKKELNVNMQKLFIGFASGVMIAASVWSLLLPALDYGGTGIMQWLPAAVGFLLGGGFLYLFDKLLPHEHIQSGITEGPKSALKKSTKLIFAVTLHNFPEGMAVGLAFSLAATSQAPGALAAAMVLAIGVAVQNIPEGAVISLPLRNEGFSRKRAFLYGAASGLAEPVAGVLGAGIAIITASILPWMLAFAAGAMIYVVIDELVPGAQDGHSNLATIGAMLGFVLMMILDVALQA